MSDLIERQAAIGAINCNITITGRQNAELVASTIGMFADRIKALPSAQKKGHWIDEETNYLCSECHRGCWVNSDYCPWCGARMEE